MLQQQSLKFDFCNIFNFLTSRKQYGGPLFLSLIFIYFSIINNSGKVNESFYCLTGVFTISFRFYLPFFKLIAYSLSCSAFTFLTLTFFLSYQDQASALKIAYIFKVFWAQSCLMVAQQFDQTIYLSKECNNFQDSKLIFMISDFKISQ